MRLSIAHKLGALVLLPAVLASALSAFYLTEVRLERQRFERIGLQSDLAYRAMSLAETVQSIVVAADTVLMEADRDAATTKLVALRQTIGKFESAEHAFLDRVGVLLSPQRKTQLALRFADFKAYQTDTAELGLTVSPIAARIQASDSATIDNRIAMVADFQAISAEIAAATETERATQRQQSADVAVLLRLVPATTIILGLMLAAFVIRNQISRPLDRLRRSMIALAGGDLTTSIPFAGKQDEVGQIAAAIAVFRDALCANRDATREAGDRSLAETRRADAIVSSTRSFEADALAMMRDLTRSVGAMGSAADDVAASSQTTLTAASTVGRAAVDASAILGTVSAAAIDLSQAATRISSRVQATKAAAGQALDQADATKEKVVSLVAAAAAIGGAAELIGNIAKQTNMLALNATIEAARAGDTGRGFAVVATEVKLLADRTAEATDIISSFVAAIQDATTVSAAAMATIRSTLDEVNVITADVTTAVLEQGRSSHAMAEALIDATGQARIVSDSINKVSATALANGERARSLQTTAAVHGHQARHLTGFISGFVDDIRAMA